MMPYQRQTGFTLVELMVAMAIGTIIILGAGQLFLTTFQTFRTVDELSRKQESLIFTVNTLIEAGRKGDMGNYAIVLDERDSDNGKRYYCVLRDVVIEEPVVDLARVDDVANCPMLPVLGGSSAFSLVTLFIGDCRSNEHSVCDTFTFRVSDRDTVINSQGPAS
ncbi:PilW family protein [Vreelandella arctica]|uniref:PilW family protein n=1 Tax=Vreelandella arctica TaxID=3126499 RepID=UPI00300DFDBA